VPYIGPDGLSDFDLVLSYTGGAALDRLRDVLGARRVNPLYGHVDPDVHRPVPAQPRYAADLSWLGTFSADRQRALEELFVRPARLCRTLKFRMAGAQYPQDFPWSENVYFDRHLPPDEHAARIFREVRASLVEHPEFERDREKLEKVCCAVQLPVQLRRAPRPSTLAA
jgi:spore maturation protein CgeB